MKYYLTNKIVTSGRLFLIEKATNTCVGEWTTALLF